MFMNPLSNKPSPVSLSIIPTPKRPVDVGTALASALTQVLPLELLPLKQYRLPHC